MRQGGRPRSGRRRANRHTPRAAAGTPASEGPRVARGARARRPRSPGRLTTFAAANAIPARDPLDRRVPQFARFASDFRGLGRPLPARDIDLVTVPLGPPNVHDPLGFAPGRAATRRVTAAWLCPTPPGFSPASRTLARPSDETTPGTSCTYGVPCTLNSFSTLRSGAENGGLLPPVSVTSTAPATAPALDTHPPSARSRLNPSIDPGPFW